MLDEYFHLLEIPPNASKQEIKRAYWRLAKKWHPDVNPGQEAQTQFIRINQAYEILINGKLPPKPVVYTPSYQESPEEELQRRLYRQKRYREQYQERAAQFARIQYEEFKKNNEVFKSSFWYIPAKIFTYFAWIVGNLVGVGFLFTPLLIVLFLDRTGVGLVLMPFSLLGLVLIAAAFRFKQDVEQYF